jgi:hypothetical protein
MMKRWLLFARPNIPFLPRLIEAILPGPGWLCPLEFGIYFSARKQHERPHPEPEQQDDDRAEPAGGQ